MATTDPIPSNHDVAVEWLQDAVEHLDAAMADYRRALRFARRALSVTELVDHLER